MMIFSAGLIRRCTTPRPTVGSVPDIPAGYETYAYLYIDGVKQIRRALEETQFEMHYQPIISAAAGNVAGREALLRWNHPQRGLVSPAEFIPLVEQSKQMLDLERWIFEAFTSSMLFGL